MKCIIAYFITTYGFISKWFSIALHLWKRKPMRMSLDLTVAMVDILAAGSTSSSHEFTLKSCSLVTFAFSSNIANGFYGNK